MTVVRPPITGDAVLDSWTDQITNLINLGFFQQSTRAAGTSGAGTQGARGLAGEDGFSAATLYLFQRVATDADIPPDLQTNLVYEYENAILYDPDNRFEPDGSTLIQEWDGWTPFIPEDPNNEAQYIWVITTNVADRDLTDSIPFTAWSTRTLLVAPTISYEMDTTGFDFIRADQLFVEAGVRVIRYVGEVGTEITTSLTADHVKWSKHSINASFDPTAPVWDNTTEYTEGTVVQRTITLTTDPTYTPSAERTYNYIALQDNMGVAPESSTTDWRLTEGSADQQNDDLWTVTDGWTEGPTIMVDNQEVLTQTEFRAELRDDVSPIPTS